MAKRVKDKQKKGDSGLLLLLLGAGGLAALALGKKPSTPGSQLETVSVSFQSGPFTPGSSHQVSVAIKNTGTAPASTVGGTIHLTDSTAVLDIALVGLGPVASIPIGATQTFLGNSSFTLSSSLPVGTQVLWYLTLQYDGTKALQANGTAFTVVAIPEAVLGLVSPPTFT